MVYFHHPRFCRQPQLPLHRIPESPTHMLPLIMQLLPEVPLVYDDDTRVPGLTSTPASTEASWVWLTACGSFFLVNVQERTVLCSPTSTLTPLVAHYLRCTGKTIQAVEVDPSATTYAAAVASAPSAHVELRASTHVDQRA